MEQTDNMVEQIGRVVANELLRNGVVYLPQVGSLYLHTQPSQITSSGGGVTSPYTVVRYSQETKCRSFVEVLSQIGNCDIAVAEDIYTRWLDRVKTPSGVQIVAVGAVVDGQVSMDRTLKLKLNPEKPYKLRIKKRTNIWLWIGGSVVSCVLVGLLANYSVGWLLNKDTDAPQPIVVKIEEPAVVLQEEITSSAVEEEVVDTTFVEPSKLDDQTTNTIAIKVSDNPQYRVVYGVFSTMENAQKGADEAHKLNVDVVAMVRPFGDKFMVNLFESDKIEECKSFMANNRVAYPDVWISKRRGE